MVGAMATVEPPVTPNPDLTPTPPASLKPKPKLMERLQEFITRYGMLAIAVHWGLFTLFLLGFMLLIRAGFKVESAAGAAGTFAGAYLACQAIKIPRFALTFAVTPLIDRLIQRIRQKKQPPPVP
ncbi:hypothetical protein F0U63_03225 [Cystobacter fuscus]|nr:hypothetical protein F0U63_03225 [Cystobacter fuscus]